jgi:hypothetical protein
MCTAESTGDIITIVCIGPSDHSRGLSHAGLGRSRPLAPYPNLNGVAPDPVEWTPDGPLELECHLAALAADAVVAEHTREDSEHGQSAVRGEPKLRPRRGDRRSFAAPDGEPTVTTLLRCIGTRRRCAERRDDLS